MGADYRPCGELAVVGDVETKNGACAGHAARNRVGLCCRLRPIPLLPDAPAAVERGQGRLYPGAGDDGRGEGWGGGADAVLPVSEEMAGRHGGRVARRTGGEQRDTGADRCSGLVQDDVVLLPAAARVAPLLPHQDECQPHD